ncbi:MAG: DUF1835 domain-containing protein [Algicola sp.]|nr:DUF1835 domain-containing protein [Algicola sp.]
MSEQTLHITNGQNLTNYLQELNVEGLYLTWHEILCEGPTEAHIDSEVFITKRKAFLSEFYDIELDEHKFKSELEKLNATDTYSEIVLWFEYDLFCHINLMAVMSLIHQRDIKQPLYLVCSGRVKGEKNLKGLSELSSAQLLAHYDNKIELTDLDRDLAISLWRTYCGKDHNLFKPYITQKSSFKYLGACLKAHLKRFPDAKSGLSVLETNILKIIKNKDIKSRHHLLGYILNYQGYYGFGDLQYERMIEKLRLFYDETDDRVVLNRKGHEALLGSHNFSSEIKNNLTFGGVKRLDYQFNSEENKLIKTIINAN